MLLAYNTNGLAHHNLLDAIELLAEIGYQGIAITLDHGALNPFDGRTEEQLAKVAESLAMYKFRSVIETGARYLLDLRHKHEPTLVSPSAKGRGRRADFLCRAIDVAAHLNSDCVSLWSGVIHDGADQEDALRRLAEGIVPVLSHADSKAVGLAFEPEPGMLIDSLDAYDRLLAYLESKGVSTEQLRLTIDVGHLHCQGELPIPAKIRASAGRLANIHIEDMRAGIHEHLMFGQGEIDFSPVIAALAEIRYDGLLSVELSRHSHEGPLAARQAYDFLRPLLSQQEL
jgi:sugar phosphate isomerase/epimerase